jgi:diacylglycerol kinase
MFKRFIISRIKAFGYTFEGLFTFVKQEESAKVHLIATIITIAASFIFNITLLEWVLVLLTIALVWAFEIVNTCIEELCDMITLERHPTIKKIKDMAGSSVLVASIISVFVGFLVFGSRIYILIFN